MATRRSKRLHLKDILSVEDSFDETSTVKKKLKTIPNTGTKESLISKLCKNESSSKPFSDPKNTNILRSRKTRSKIKSSYFESPSVSEESHSDCEPDNEPPRKRKSKSTNNVYLSRKKQPYESKNDSSSGEFIDSRASRKSSDSLVEKLTQGYKKSFESESDSSSDEGSNTNKDVQMVPTLKSNESGPDIANDLSENSDTAIDCRTTEYFDFTPLLSQVTQAETDEKTANEKLVSEKQGTTNNVSLDSESKRKNSIVSTKINEKKHEQLEVFELLAMGENTDLSAKDIQESVSKRAEEYEIPKQIEVLLDTTLAKKKKRSDDLEMAFRRRLNNIKRENQIYIHKVHILCWIAHGNYLNNLLNSPENLSLALSLLPSKKCYPPKRMNIEYLEDLINWFNEKVKLKKDSVDDSQFNVSMFLPSQFQKLEAESKLHLCFMFICVLRALGVKCRLIINLNVLPIKPTSDQLLPVTVKKDDINKSVIHSSNDKCKQNIKNSQDKKKSSDETKQKEKSPSSFKNKKQTTTSKKTEKTTSKNMEKEGSRRSSRHVGSKSEYFKKDNLEHEKQDKKTASVSSKVSRRVAAKKTSSNVQEQIKDEPVVEEMSSSGSDLDSAEEFVTPKKKKRDRRVLSSEDEVTVVKAEIKSNKQPNKINYWAEVFLEAEEKWASIDVYKKSYLCDEELYKNASHPVRYVLAWNNDQTLKDVTKRYVPQYLTVTRKLRVDDKWWADTLFPFKPPLSPQDKEEDEELEKKLEELPLPKSISEYKNHPLYALKRHLLKFQAIYPPDAPPLGFIKDEPVYSRLCVHQLHGREMWIKEAKVVKVNEKPYKIVKKRQKKDKYGTGEGPEDLELFGVWQVEDYVPPTAKDGIVPRNAFGNVELFKPSMLPKGTVYLQIPGLQRIANKLNIDCAAAITGFEYSTNGWSYPVKDGFVVCEEFKDILLDAYNQEVEEAEKKEKQKREERVYSNWKCLIKGLFIAERLKRKYNFGEPGTSKTKPELKEKKVSTK